MELYSRASTEKFPGERGQRKKTEKQKTKNAKKTEK